jgi:hypothetical protein
VPAPVPTPLPTPAPAPLPVPLPTKDSILIELNTVLAYIQQRQPKSVIIHAIMNIINEIQQVTFA